MPLPEGGKTPWPPAAHAQSYRRYLEHAAWYSGDPNQLANFYAYPRQASTEPGIEGTIYPSQHSIWRINFDRFWARAATSPWRRQMVHMPIAADIATTSADLLFSDQADYLIEEANQPKAAPGSMAAQDRLLALIEDADVQSVLTEAAETGAAMGGVYLRIVWDQEREPDHPLLCRVDADGAVPEFWYSRLQAVTFWRQVEPPAGSKTVWRLLERHEPGYILSGLYEGTGEELGELRPLEQILAYPTAPVVETGIDQLTAVYVPNMRPNRWWRDSALGKSDYDGVEALMDSLDETWTSWMRDLRLGRARLLVPQEYLDAQGKGKGAVFDLDQEVFETLPMAVSRDENAITPSQFNIRSQEHLATAMALVERIVTAAGYSASTFGVNDQQRGVTATEIISREKRSYVTRAKKIAYWSGPLQQILEALLAIDARHFQPHEVFRPRVDWPAEVQDDPAQVAATVVTLRQAQAASTQTLVEMLHDDWSDDEVAAEVQRILAERAPAVVTSQQQPAAGPPGAGGQPAGATVVGGTHEALPAGSTSGGDSNGQASQAT